MKKLFKKALFVVVTVFVFTLSFVLGTNKVSAESKGEIVIGGMGPLTGPAAVYGTAVKNSAQMAVDEINAKGGVNGYTFKLEFMDDQHNAQNVDTQYAALVQKGMQVSIGCVTTKPCLEFKELSKNDNLFFITPSATGDSVPEYSNAFQMCFADSDQGTFSAKYIKDNFKDVKTVGVLYNSADDYSKGIFTKFKAEIGTAYTLVETSFTEDAPTDLSSQVNLLKDCDLVFLPIYYTPASTFITQADGTLKDNCIYFGCDGLDGIDVIEGFDVNSFTQEISYLSHFNAASTDEATATFVTNYKAKYGADTLSQFGASAYDCVYVIYEALKAADPESFSNTSTMSEMCEVIKAVVTGENFSFNGVTGKNVKWGTDGHVNKAAGKYTVNANRVQAKETKGCKSSFSIVAIIPMMVVATSVFALKKKKEEN